MKKLMITGMVTGLMVWGNVAQVVAQKALPSRDVTHEFLAAVGITVATDGGTNCTAVLTGLATMTSDAAVDNGSNTTAATEILSMDLAGVLPDGSPVQLLAGADLIGPPTSGLITSTNSLFPADNYFDFFVQVQLPGGTNAVNQEAIRLEAEIFDLPPINSLYTNATAGAVALVDAANTNNVIGEIIEIWFEPADKGKDTLIGVSLDVTGTNSAGFATMRICPEGNETAAVSEISGSNLFGPIAPNFVCDELFGTNLLFSAKLNKKLRASDWRGTHEGNWIIYYLDDKNETVLVAGGKMEGTSGVGTHRDPVTPGNPDACDECAHFEGRLKGKLLNKKIVPRGKLVATYAGQFVDDSNQPVGCCPPPIRPPSGPIHLTIDGVAITKCLSTE